MPLFLVREPVEKIAAQAAVRLTDNEDAAPAVRRVKLRPARYEITVAANRYGAERTYIDALRAAEWAKCSSVVLPVFEGPEPYEVRLEYACDAVRQFLAIHEMTVTIAAEGAPKPKDPEQLAGDLAEEHEKPKISVRTPNASYAFSAEMMGSAMRIPDASYSLDECIPCARMEMPEAQDMAMFAPSAETPKKPRKAERKLYAPKQAPRKKTRKRYEESVSVLEEKMSSEDVSLSLADRIAKMDMSFSEKLTYLIDLKGMTDSECYHRANIDRKVFSKIRCRKGYIPTKVTILSFAVALRLTREETDELLRTAGFALSQSDLFDVIVSFYIDNGVYDAGVINNMLFQYDQKLLGNLGA